MTPTGRPGASESRLVLRFRLTTPRNAGLEALRSARRSMLLEEGARSPEKDEPALDGAIFSATEVIWEIAPRQKDRCLRKLEQLIERANRNLEAILAFEGLDGGESGGAEQAASVGNAA